jgi:hypothetical protein
MATSMEFVIEPLTSSFPPFTMVRPVYWLLPVSVSVPAPTLTSEPPKPAFSSTPETVVERLLLPTVS